MGDAGSAGGAFLKPALFCGGLCGICSRTPLAKMHARSPAQEGAELTCSQFARLGGATLDAFCWDARNHLGLISETFQIFLGHPGIGSKWLKDALRFVPLLMLFSWVSGLVGRATIFSFHSPPAGLSKELVAAMLPQLPRLCCDAQASQARNGNRPTRSLGLTHCLLPAARFRIEIQCFHGRPGKKIEHDVSHRNPSARSPLRGRSPKPCRR